MLNVTHILKYLFGVISLLNFISCTLLKVLFYWKSVHSIAPLTFTVFLFN